MSCRCGFEKTEKNAENHNYCVFIPDETVALIADLRAALADAQARVGELEKVVVFIYRECDWEYQPGGDGGGDNRIGSACKDVLGLSAVRAHTRMRNAVLEEAAELIEPKNARADWTTYAKTKAECADIIRAAKKGE